MLSFALSAFFINFFRVVFPESGASSKPTVAPAKPAPNKAIRMFLFVILMWFQEVLPESGQSHFHPHCNFRSGKLRLKLFSPLEHWDMDDRGNDLAGTFGSAGHEMARLIDRKDWSHHPLGKMESWPPLLRGLLNTILGNRFPMLIYWGPELYCFYNDAFRPSLGNDGKHPGILGATANEAFAEAWGTMQPRFGRVLSTGESFWHEDELVPILRNGRIEDVYWTYSPAKDGSGQVVGILVTCLETTEKVAALAQSRSNEDLIRSIVHQAPVAVAVFNGPDHVVEIANERALEIWGRERNAVEGRPILEVLPELKEQGFGKFLGDALAGIPYYATELPVHFQHDLETVTAYLNFTFEPLVGPDGAYEAVMAVGSDVTETVLAKQRAESGEARFRLLADSMPQFVWTGKPDGELNYFNQAVSDYSGIPASELNAQGWLEIVHPDEREANMRMWTEAITSGKDFLFEHRFRRKDGEYRWQLSRARPLRDKEGKIHLWVGTSTDIQTMKEQEQEKNFLIGMAGHEMRNPLSTLRSCVDLLQIEGKDDMETEQRHILDMMGRQLEKLTRLLSDLVDVSTLKQGTLELDLSHFNVTEVVRNVVDEMRRNHPDRIFNMEGCAQAPVHADRYRIAQVLGNLLGNAVKYSAKGKEVGVACELGPDTVLISVADHGVGVPKSEQELIFQRFYRVKNKERATHIDGFGIGLYLVADIVKRHGGQMAVESEEGKGSIFSFTLPLAV